MAMTDQRLHPMLRGSSTDSPFDVADLGYAAIPSHAAPSITGTSVSAPADVSSVAGTAPVGNDRDARRRDETPGAY